MLYTRWPWRNANQNHETHRTPPRTAKPKRRRGPGPQTLLSRLLTWLNGAQAYNVAGVLTQRTWRLMPPKTSTRVFTAAIRSCQTLEAAETSPAGDGPTLTLPDNGRVVGSGKEGAVEPREDTEEPRTQVTSRGSRPEKAACMLYGSGCATLWKG